MIGRPQAAGHQLGLVKATPAVLKRCPHLLLRARNCISKAVYTSMMHRKREAVAAELVVRQAEAGFGGALTNICKIAPGALYKAAVSTHIDKAPQQGQQGNCVDDSGP